MARLSMLSVLGVALAAVAVVVTPVAGICQCSFRPGTECQAVLLTTAEPVTTCRSAPVPCGPCFCDPEGDLVCETTEVAGWTFTGSAGLECISTEITVATCPAPTATPTAIPVEELPTPRPISTPQPSPTLLPPTLIEKSSTCTIDRLIQWIPPLRCTVSAAEIPPTATIQGAAAFITQGANGTAVIVNERDVVANGTYQAIIFNTFDPQEYWEDWADIRTNLRRLVLQPGTSSTEIAVRPRFDTTVYSTPAFNAYAQDRLVTQRQDIEVVLRTDKQLAISNAFSGGRLVSAYSFAQVTLTVYYTI
mmetsp:Transcript_6366/g.16999  ORF Transcript_6366/g.16999 Transcript_6366/m.16999 type:complete len:306 (+) Transcript_6366:106-1023(+)